MGFGLGAAVVQAAQFSRCKRREEKLTMATQQPQRHRQSPEGTELGLFSRCKMEDLAVEVRGENGAWYKVIAASFFSSNELFWRFLQNTVRTFSMQPADRWTQLPPKIHALWIARHPYPRLPPLPATVSLLMSLSRCPTEYFKLDLNRPD